jgi:hypothetical protein
MERTASQLGQPVAMNFCGREGLVREEGEGLVMEKGERRER